MITGTRFQLITPERVRENFVIDLTQIPMYHYSDIIPEQYRTENQIINKAVAAVMLHAKGYITGWELTKVAEWVKAINPYLLFEVMKSCLDIYQGDRLWK